MADVRRKPVDEPARLPRVPPRYKFAGGLKRSLARNDRQAYRKIVQEFSTRLRFSRRQRDKALLYRAAARAVREAEPGAIYVALRPDGKLVSLTPYPSQDVFVRETEWSVKPVKARTTFALRLGRGTAITRGEAREWRRVDGRRHRWTSLWHDPDRWPAFRKDVPRAAALTSPEEAALVRAAREHVPRPDPWARYGGLAAVYTCVAADGAARAYAVFRTPRPKIPPRVVLTERQRVEDWEWFARAIEFERRGDAFEVRGLGQGWRTEDATTYRRDHLRWLYRDEAAFARVAAWRERKDAFERRRSSLEAVGWAVAEYVAERVDALWWERARRKFVEVEHGDPDLWEDEKKHVRREREVDRGAWRAVATAAHYLVDAGRSPDGMTVGELFDRAVQLGWKPGACGVRGFRSNEVEDVAGVPRTIKIKLDPDVLKAIGEGDGGFQQAPEEAEDPGPPAGADADPQAASRGRRRDLRRAQQVHGESEDPGPPTGASADDAEGVADDDADA